MLYAWDGPGASGVDWDWAGFWWPYQRSTFVTPPFAGYISGHSTFSRAAAEVLTLLTGDPYFPGGMGEYHAPQNAFLLFEEGPSVDLTLQWATYRDASDQTSLSRIWGGIHPPADDIPGRRIGARIGTDAFLLAERFFEGEAPAGEAPAEPVGDLTVFPNPLRVGHALVVRWEEAADEAVVGLYTAQGRRVQAFRVNDRRYVLFDTFGLASGVYLVRLTTPSGAVSRTVALLN
jgi:hypothetical protein